MTACRAAASGTFTGTGHRHRRRGLLERPPLVDEDGALGLVRELAGPEEVRGREVELDLLVDLVEELARSLHAQREQVLPRPQRQLGDGAANGRAVSDLSVADGTFRIPALDERGQAIAELAVDADRDLELAAGDRPVGREDDPELRGTAGVHGRR